MYAIAILFGLRQPAPPVLRVAESCISQALLSEPGCAQKAFALLTYWEFNGATFDRDLVAETVQSLSALHESRGLGSDIAWAMAFAIDNKMHLSRKVGLTLSRLDDDAVAIHITGRGEGRTVHAANPIEGIGPRRESGETGRGTGGDRTPGARIGTRPDGHIVIQLGLQDGNVRLVPGRFTIQRVRLYRYR
jgi:hypothetical protein